MTHYEISTYNWEDFIQKLSNATLVKESICPELIKQAKQTIDNNIRDSIPQAFLVLTALNLLNAAIKVPEYKKRLSYPYIKGKAVALLAALAKDELYGENLKYYYAQREHCLYFQIYGVVFSFHQVPDSEAVRHAANMPPIIWPGIRLQMIAASLMRRALGDAISE